MKNYEDNSQKSTIRVFFSGWYTYRVLGLKTGLISMHGYYLKRSKIRYCSRSFIVSSLYLRRILARQQPSYGALKNARRRASIRQIDAETAQYKPQNDPDRRGRTNVMRQRPDSATGGDAGNL
jgi:hypothetical protein